MMAISTNNSMSMNPTIRYSHAGVNSDARHGGIACLRLFSTYDFSLVSES